MNELTEKRTPELIGAEIRMYVDAGRRLSLLCGIEIGRRLAEAKEMLEHGEWLPWLEKETEFSDRSAARYMKLFEEYGASQQGLFGPETNSPTLSNLPISKALALLSVPENERAEFAEEVDAEHISVRELQQAIEEKKAAEARALAALQETDAVRHERDALSLALKHEKDMVRELQARPVEVAVEKDEEAVAAAAKEAREKAEAEAAKKISYMEAELEEAKKKLKAADAGVEAFGIRFNTLQNDFAMMMEEYRKIRERSPETGTKLKEAVRELLEYYRQETEKE